MDYEQAKDLLAKLDKQASSIKEEIFKISWSMRGGVSSQDLFWSYSREDRQIMADIIKHNIENTKNARMPLL